MLLKSIIDFFNLEGGTRPHIVNIFRPRMLVNYFIFFLFRKFNPERPPYYPVNLMVEVSTRCNLSCPSCERELLKKEEGLPEENVKLENIKHLSSVLPYVYSVYLVSGIGEPFLNPEFWDIHGFIKKFGIKTGYFTNASFLTEELVKKTFEEKVNTVIVSIDTFEPEKFHKIKRGADFDKTVSVIKLFGSHKKKINAGFFSLGLNFIFRKDNYKDILNFLDFAKELNVDYVHCSTLISHLVENKELTFFDIPEKEREAVFCAAKEKARKIKIGIRLPRSSLKENNDCGYLWRCLCVFYNGDVGACPYFRSDRYFYYHAKQGKIIYDKKKVSNAIVGNYLRQDIRRIWNADKIRALRRTVISYGEKSPCAECYYKYNLH